MTLPFPGIPKVPLQGFAQKDKVLLIERSIQPPVVRHPLTFAFAGFHGQEHIKWVTCHTCQAKHNDTHNQQSQHTLQKPNQDVALHISLLSYCTSLIYSRCVKNPVILPGKVYSEMYFGFTPASANSQNRGI